MRSFKKNGVFLTEVDGRVFKTNNSMPDSLDEFENKQVIIDVEMFQDNTYEIVLYRYGEPKPRKLKLFYKTE